MTWPIFKYCFLLFVFFKERTESERIEKEIKTTKETLKVKTMKKNICFVGLL